MIGDGERPRSHIREADFDLSIIDLFCTFAAGASVVLIPESFLAFPARIAQLISSEHITVWNSVPALMELFQKEKDCRIVVARALGGIGPGAKAAVPLLLEALQDKTTMAQARDVIQRLADAAKQDASKPDAAAAAVAAAAANDARRARRSGENVQRALERIAAAPRPADELDAVDPVFAAAARELGFLDASTQEPPK